MRTFEEINSDLAHAMSINDAEALLRYAAELDALGTRQAEATASNSRGWALYLRSDYPAALEQYQSALALHEELGNRRGVASVTGSIGIVHYDTGDYTASLEYYHRALALHVELGERRRVARITANIGSVHVSTGDYPAALEHYHRALALHEELGDRSGVASVTGNIGSVHSRTGDYPTALEHFHRALALHEELGDRRGMASVTGNIGVLHMDTGDHPAALELCHRALALYEELDDRSGVAFVTGNIGSVHNSTGNYPAALEHFHRALAVREELGVRSGVASIMVNMLHAYVSLGSEAQAHALLQSMDTMHIDEPGVRIERELHRAVLLQRSGDLDGAAVTLHNALAEAQKQSLRLQAALIHKAMRDVSHGKNDFAGYVEHNNEYTRITEEINGKETTLKLAMQEAEKKMAKERNEHEKHLAVLHSTLPKHIADRVARGETVNDHYDTAAVIFLDIVSFTTISEQLSSDQVVQLLEQIFTAVDAVCERHDVVKIKTIGDSYMAVAFPRFPRNDSEPVPHSVRNDSALTSFVNEARDVVLRAADAALDMLIAIADLPESLPESLREALRETLTTGLQVRIGLHVGPVTAGVIGKERLQYDVWGDTVNVASRMESTSAPGRIHVSEAFANALKGERAKERKSETAVIPSGSEEPGTWHVAPGTWHLELRGETELKGKGLMTTYWLDRPLP